MSEPILDRVLAALPAASGPATPLLVAWSGGLDSTALLHLLIRLLPTRPDLRLHALHVDHGLRPSSADDARFCLELGRAWGVDTRVVRLSVAEGASTQLQARVQRYAALEGAAAEIGAPYVATAHHADDALETALLHGARGSSAPAVASLLLPTTLAGSGVELVRPLLELRRDELLGYARDHALGWREDPTNAATDYTRNRLRHEGLPALFETPAERDAARGRLDDLAQIAAATSSAAQDLLAEARLRPPWIDAHRLDRERLRQADPDVVREALRQAVSALHAAHLPHVTAEALLDAVYDARPALRSFTGHRVVARVERGRVDLLPSCGQGTRLIDARRAEPMRLPLASTGQGARGWLPWFEHRLTWRPARVGEKADGIDTLIIAAADLDAAHRITGPPKGARLALDGSGRSRSVRDLLAAKRIPASERWRWPCLYTGEALIWVCGVRAREGADRHAAQKGDLAVEFCLPPTL